MPAAAIREAAHAYAKADRAMICWTLGITEHHNAVDNVLALISLSLLTGHVGRYGSGLNPLRGQNNVQGGGDMGALPDRLPGFQHVENDALRDNCEQIWQRRVPPKRGKHLSGMFEAMDRGELTSLYVLGENPLQSEADRHLTEQRLMGVDLLVVQDIFLTATAEIADVVLPASAAWAETRARSRTRAAGPAGAQGDRAAGRGTRRLWICSSSRVASATTGARPRPRRRGTRYVQFPRSIAHVVRRVEAEGGLQWPCYDETNPASCPRLAPVGGPGAGQPCAVRARGADPPVDELSDRSRCG